jgi:hypothetical protein
VLSHIAVGVVDLIARVLTPRISRLVNRLWELPAFLDPVGNNLFSVIKAPAAVLDSILDKRVTLYWSLNRLIRLYNGCSSLLRLHNFLGSYAPCGFT